jgi:hypothetical protein
MFSTSEMKGVETSCEGYSIEFAGLSQNHNRIAGTSNQPIKILKKNCNLLENSIIIIIKNMLKPDDLPLNFSST